MSQRHIYDSCPVRVSEENVVPGTAMCSHVPKLGRAQPGRGEQKVRYYGYYSNVLRGKRKKEEQDNTISCIIEEGSISVEQRKSWARLIQKIYEG